MNDSAALARAASLAGEWMTFPNPRVGCVIIDDAGIVVGEGAHHAAGQPHAEVEALRSAGERARGATAYVTLEPCAHQGRTGPCADALIQAGIRRVVYAVPDPTAEAAGGAHRLRDAGVEAVHAPSADAELVNEHWLHAMRHARPFVTMKIAASLDGRVAAGVGVRTPITGPATRVRVHALRASLDAVLVGTGTALIDDPELTVRDVACSAQPRRYVMGTRVLPPTLRIFGDGVPGTQLRTRDPRAALQMLHSEAIRHVLVEAGPGIARAFLEAGCVDELVWISAPRTLGAGPKALGDELLSDVMRWQVRETQDVDGDLWRRLRPIPAIAIP